MLPDDVWSNILSISSMEQYSDLEDEISSNSQQWWKWCCSEHPENVTFPKQMDKKIRGLNRLALIMTFRPDRMAESALAVIEKTLQIGHRPSNISSILIGLASGGNFEEPVIIKSSLNIPIENILRKILPVCHPALTTNENALMTVCIGSGQEAAVTAVMKLCAKKGYWLLFKSTIHSDIFYNLIDSELQEYKKTGANRRFKVWIYSTSVLNTSQCLSLYSNIVEFTVPELLRESIEYIYELLGEAKIANYITDIMKLHLLGGALMQIAFQTRQNFHFDISEITQKIGEFHLHELEAILAEYVSGRLSDSISLGSLISPLYVSLSKHNKIFKVVSKTVEHYTSSRILLDLSTHVSSLTHYTVPRSNTLTEHLSMLEFVYKAPANIIANASQSLCNAQNVYLCRLIENTLHQTCTQIDKDEFPFKNWIDNLTTSIQDLLDHPLHFPPVLKYYIEKEIRHLVSLMMTVLPLLITTDVEKIAQTLNCKSTFSSSLPLMSLRQNVQIGKKINILKEKSQYFLSIQSQGQLTVSLDLGKYCDPLCILSWQIRKIWMENMCNEFIITSLAISEDETTILENVTEVKLENLLLLGADWDAQMQKLKRETEKYMDPLFKHIQLSISSMTDNIRKICKSASGNVNYVIFTLGHKMKIVQ